MSWLWLYLAASVAFTVGWILAAGFARRDSGRDLCGRADCVYCSPRERRQPEIPPGVLILKSPKAQPRRASTN